MPQESYAATLRLLMDAMTTVHHAMDALPEEGGALHDNFHRASDLLLVLHGQVAQYATAHP
jgi:hypothetical protein